MKAKKKPATPKKSYSRMDLAKKKRQRMGLTKGKGYSGKK